MSKTNDVSTLDRYALADEQLHAVAGGTWSELIIGMADARTRFVFPRIVDSKLLPARPFQERLWVASQCRCNR